MPNTVGTTIRFTGCQRGQTVIAAGDPNCSCQRWNGVTPSRRAMRPLGSRETITIFASRPNKLHGDHYHVQFRSWIVTMKSTVLGVLAGLAASVQAGVAAQGDASGLRGVVVE